MLYEIARRPIPTPAACSALASQGWKEVGWRTERLAADTGRAGRCAAREGTRRAYVMHGGGRAAGAAHAAACAQRERSRECGASALRQPIVQTWHTSVSLHVRTA